MNARPAQKYITEFGHERDTLPRYRITANRPASKRIDQAHHFGSPGSIPSATIAIESLINAQDGDLSMYHSAKRVLSDCELETLRDHLTDIIDWMREPHPEDVASVATSACDEAEDAYVDVHDGNPLPLDILTDPIELHHSAWVAGWLAARS